jgi:hypothetical protein
MSPFRYRDNWSLGSGRGNANRFGTYYSNTGTWIGVYRQSGNNNYTYPSRTGNPDLALERRREFNFGIDAVMLKNKLSLEANFYYNLRYDVITTRPNLTPIISGTTSALPYVNYNSFSYRGVELGISYKNRAGDLFYMIGGNAFTQKAIVEQLDEPSYRNDYQKLTGGPADAIRGLLYLGRFASDEEALAIPQFGETLHAGDLMYEDKNGDGVVDDNDAQYIGHSSPKLYYALNLNLMWKNVELTLTGSGRALYNVMLNNKYFTCGAGDNTYSKFILNDIDENGLGKEYPRLTYYQVANNFKTSSFRLADGGFFKLQNIGSESAMVEGRPWDKDLYKRCQPAYSVEDHWCRSGEY